jgi:hypothetical protein
VALPLIGEERRDGHREVQEVQQGVTLLLHQSTGAWQLWGGLSPVSGGSRSREATVVIERTRGRWGLGEMVTEGDLFIAVASWEGTTQVQRGACQRWAR